MSIHTIVLTGGPCAGKSTGLSRIERELTEKGYKVFVVAETATELLQGGIKPDELSILDFQKAIFEIQLKKECVYRETAERYSEKYNQNCIILFDRGILDCKAFMTKEDFKALLKMEDKKEIKLRDNYEGVFHLITAANGAESFYSNATNSVRRENLKEACIVDENLISAYTGHPHLRIIDNSTNFKEKIDRLMTEIYSLLGEPVPTEIERKYLIKMPDIANLLEKYNVTKSNIIQTYLKVNEEKTEKRVRQRGINGVYSYYYTEKIGSGLKRIEKEKKITEKQYLSYLMEADTSLHQIRKDRYCFVYKNNYIELDIYPFWKDYAVVEVELTTENQEVELPDDFEVIKDVTEDDNFKNKNLAKNTYIL